MPHNLGGRCLAVLIALLLAAGPASGQRARREPNRAARCRCCRRRHCCPHPVLPPTPDSPAAWLRLSYITLHPRNANLSSCCPLAAAAAAAVDASLTSPLGSDGKPPQFILFTHDDAVTERTHQLMLAVSSQLRTNRVQKCAARGTAVGACTVPSQRCRYSPRGANGSCNQWEREEEQAVCLPCRSPITASRRPTPAPPWAPCESKPKCACACECSSARQHASQPVHCTCPPACLIPMTHLAACLLSQVCDHRRWPER